MVELFTFNIQKVGLLTKERREESFIEKEKEEKREGRPIPRAVSGGSPSPVEGKRKERKVTTTLLARREKKNRGSLQSYAAHWNGMPEYDDKKKGEGRGRRLVSTIPHSRGKKGGGSTIKNGSN